MKSEKIAKFPQVCTCGCLQTIQQGEKMILIESKPLKLGHEPKPSFKVIEEEED